MSKVILDMAISIDGCIATADGEAGGLHGYLFSPSTEPWAIVQVVPKVLGDGMRLFDAGTRPVKLKLDRAVAAPDALHVAYQIAR